MKRKFCLLFLCYLVLKSKTWHMSSYCIESVEINYMTCFWLDKCVWIKMVGKVGLVVRPQGVNKYVYLVKPKLNWMSKAKLLRFSSTTQKKKRAYELVLSWTNWLSRDPFHRPYITIPKILCLSTLLNILISTLYPLFY